MKVREIAEEEFAPFFGLMAEIECGSHFDQSNPEHIEWLNYKIRSRYASGTRFFASYSDDGEPVGFAALQLETSLHSEWTNGELVDIGIFPQHRRNGYGSMLLEFAEDLARQQKCYALFIQTYAADHWVIAFYGKNGYIPVATLPDTNGPGDEGTVWMRKVLG